MSIPELSDSEEQFAMLLTILLVQVNPKIEMSLTFDYVCDMLVEGFIDEDQAVHYGRSIAATAQMPEAGEREVH